jgi:hypothetical protein
MPARFAALQESGAISEDAMAELPPAELLDQVVFITDAQIAAATAVLEENWGPMVADA